MSKTKKVTKQFLDDIKHEVLGKPESKEKKNPNEPKRSTLDVILNKPAQQPDTRPSPIVEAMLQTQEDEEQMAEGKRPDRLEAEMSQLRRKREQELANWRQLQEQIMAKPVSDKDNAPVMPTSSKKGPGAPKGKAQGIESFKRGKKN